ncbi:type IV pilus twitching motility protein PilT [Paludicola sp. MB14-C6]|uniref:type IV pilus twitching motility protein PilT n=1 Tax=Paludihabitans sp. MB14-C6 TaxID=3070656 RepID=UPI0027DBB27F|nr:type IV pilus twitching motility protein PilT [Paludicola sp. MB14-C6]WMJ22104.1 type IV pilus twitching motility protein PilT [Paludicola sp. MB14-C6]
MNFTVNELLKFARENDCSDLHFTEGAPPVFRQHGALLFAPEYPKMTKMMLEDLILPLLDVKTREILDEGGDVDFSFDTNEGKRNRVNVYRQKGGLAAAFRLLQEDIPNLEQLHLPNIILEFCELSRGMVLITGPTGSGKSTTLAAMIDYINKNYKKHIITIEDPIEYIHYHGKCMINQRELGRDVDSFANALRSALREDPDVILVGEMRDLETISAAITAAETGHLVLSTLHTTGAANTVDRMIDVFPQTQQNQIRIQLSAVLKGVVSQLLIPTADHKSRIPAVEVLKVTDAVASLIRENKGHQVDSAIQTGAKEGMQSLDVELAKLVNEGVIDITDAIEKCADYTVLHSYLTVNNQRGEYIYRHN